MTKIISIIKGSVRCGFAAAILSLLFAACSDNPALEQDDDRMQLTLDVIETGWEGQTINASTRAGETLEGLRAVANPASPADGEGFGIYCSGLNYENTQVIWDEANGWWKIGANNHNNYWQRNETGTIDVYAYAPFKTGGYTVSANKLTFVAQKHGYPGYTNLLSGGNVDLLQANASISRSSNNPAQLTFNHKLAKLTFGTITNNTGETIQLNGFTVRGTINSEAKLDLTDGTWSGHVNSVAEIKLPPPFVYIVHSPADMAGDPPAGFAAKALIEPLLDKQTVLPNMAMGRSILLIPNANGKITVTVEVNNNSGETFTFPIELVEGTEKIVNITIGRNHEVVIEE
jgi:hypothetical protein